MSVHINSRYTVVNGWLVDIIAKKVVKPSSRSLRKLSPNLKGVILDQKLWAWEDFFSSENLIVPFADPSLFNLLQVKEYQFAELHDRSTVVLSNELIDAVLEASNDYSPCHAIESAFVQGNTST